MDRLLQRAASAPRAGRPHADGGLARRRGRTEGCGHDGQRWRVAHMPTGAEADAASCCVIEKEHRAVGLPTKKPPQAVPLRESTSVSSASGSLLSMNG